MRKTIVSLIALAVVAAVLMTLMPSKELTEAQRVAAANEKYYEEIFSRCTDIRPLTQFIEFFQPSEALEFFDRETMKEVVSVSAVVETDAGFKAGFVAPVSINENGKYRLTGQASFSIEDLKGGVFTKKLPGMVGSGPSIRLGPVLWNRFVASGYDIESLREVEIHSDEA